MIILKVILILMVVSMVVMLGYVIYLTYRDRKNYKILESQLNNISQKQQYQRLSQWSNKTSEDLSNERKRLLKLLTYSESIGSRISPYFVLFLTFYFNMY